MFNNEDNQNNNQEQTKQGQEQRSSNEQRTELPKPNQGEIVTKGG